MAIKGKNKEKKAKEVSENIETINPEEATTMPEPENVETTAPATAPTEAKRPRRLTKDLTGGKVTIEVLGGAKGKMIFDPADLPEVVREQMVPFGCGHKLGDAAAGLSGVEAEEAIVKVWEGLLKGDWTVRAPSTPKISVAEVKGKIDAIEDPDEKAAAMAILAKLGYTL